MHAAFFIRHFHIAGSCRPAACQEIQNIRFHNPANRLILALHRNPPFSQVAGLHERTAKSAEEVAAPVRVLGAGVRTTCRHSRSSAFVLCAEFLPAVFTAQPAASERNDCQLRADTLRRERGQPRSAFLFLCCSEKKRRIKRRKKRKYSDMEAKNKENRCGDEIIFITL